MDVIMPKMGESVSEGTVIKWHKKKGEQVKKDEIIFEISTDKVDTEIPSPADGVLSDIKANEGDTVEVGSVVAVIDENGSAAKVKEETENNTIKEDKVESKKDEPVKESKIDSSKQDMKPTVSENKPTNEIKSDSGKLKGKTVEIAMPKMGESVMEGTIIKWHKKVGETVKKDETIFEISTDKVDTEVPSPETGVLAEVLVGEQETVEVGTVVAKLSIESESGEEETTTGDIEVIEQELKPEEKHKPVSMHDNFSNTVSEERQSPVDKDKEEINKNVGFLSPLVMNIMQKENVSFDELHNIKGTGLNNRITKKDILSYIENRSKQKPSEVKEERKEKALPTGRQAEPKKEYAAPSYTSAQMQPVYSSADIEKIPMDNIRQKIMQHMINSRDTSVHVSAMLEVDMTRIYNFIKDKRDEYIQKEGVKLTYMAFISYAAIKALKEFPLVNSTIEGSTIIKKKFINLGIAVAIQPTGLIVPNIKGADERSVIGLAKSINDLAERARKRKLSPDDISNGTFTITNYGVFGTIFGTPIINQPEVAILGVGTVTKKPVVVEIDGGDTIAIKPIMALTLSHDHRLVDGMLGGKFLKFIKDFLENFDISSI